MTFCGERLALLSVGFFFFAGPLIGTDALPFVSLTGSDRHAGTTGVMGQLM